MSGGQFGKQSPKAAPTAGRAGATCADASQLDRGGLQPDAQLRLGINDCRLLSTHYSGALGLPAPCSQDNETHEPSGDQHLHGVGESSCLLTARANGTTYWEEG